jgi:hypothetical protein
MIARNVGTADLILIWSVGASTAILMLSSLLEFAQAINLDTPIVPAPASVKAGHCSSGFSVKRIFSITRRPTTACSGLAAQRRLHQELSVRLAADAERYAAKVP